MRDLSDQVVERCGCVLRNTHQIPCACELRQASDSRTPISVERIHVFWRTFVIEEGVDRNEFRQSDDLSEEHRYLAKLIDEVKGCDAAVVRTVSLVINDLLHPDQASYQEPDVNTKIRGRPKGSKSTKRDPSRWEYKERGRGRGRSSSGRSSSSGHGRSSSSSVHNRYTEDVADGICRDIHEFAHADKIPGIILPYVEGYVDVLGDGNCGFRVVASYIFGDENQSQLIRNAVANEIQAHRDLYTNIYYDGIEEGIRRIRWDGGRCGPDHWMQSPEDLFPVATFFNAAVFVFGFGNGKNYLHHCSTILPLCAPSTATKPDKEIVIAHLGDSYRHYIRLDLSRNFPVPPFNTLWEHNHKPVVHDWVQSYASRRQSWETLRNTIS